MVGRHQLAVLPEEPVGTDQEQRVVERAGPLRLALVDADRAVEVVLAAGVGQAVDHRAGHLDRAVPHALPELVRSRRRTPPGAPRRSTDRARRRSRAAPRAARRRPPPRRAGGPPCRRWPRRRGSPGWPGRRPRGRSGSRVTTVRSYPPRVPFTIAQVTPWPWEKHHEVNRFVERLSDELCGAGPPRASWSRPPTRASWCARAARRSTRCIDDPDALFDEPGCASVVAVGQSLPFRRGGSVSLPIDVSRTLEDLLDRRRARLRARARAVRAERCVGGAAPLARAERRDLPLDHRALRLDPGGAQGGRAAVRPPRRPHRELRRHA